MDKFRRMFTELSVRDTTMAGYYSLTFLFPCSSLFLSTQTKVCLEFLPLSENLRLEGFYVSLHIMKLA